MAKKKAKVTILFLFFGPTPLVIMEITKHAGYNGQKSKSNLLSFGPTPLHDHIAWWLVKIIKTKNRLPKKKNNENYLENRLPKKKNLRKPLLDLAAARLVKSATVFIQINVVCLPFQKSACICKTLSIWVQALQAGEPQQLEDQWLILHKILVNSYCQA